ncbi:MAG TPA: hypothetical protein VFV50_18355 [Bdellovibrionales bacterium]|nr:hypothetical protein [Bdellovibrionales bacterium]
MKNRIVALIVLIALLAPAAQAVAPILIAAGIVLVRAGTAAVSVYVMDKAVTKGVPFAYKHGKRGFDSAYNWTTAEAQELDRKISLYMQRVWGGYVYDVPLMQQARGYLDVAADAVQAACEERIAPSAVQLCQIDKSKVFLSSVHLSRINYPFAQTKSHRKNEFHFEITADVFLKPDVPGEMIRELAMLQFARVAEESNLRLFEKFFEKKHLQAGESDFASHAGDLAILYSRELLYTIRKSIAAPGAVVPRVEHSMSAANFTTHDKFLQLYGPKLQKIMALQPPFFVLNANNPQQARVSYRVQTIDQIAAGKPDVMVLTPCDPYIGEREYRVMESLFFNLPACRRVLAPEIAAARKTVATSAKQNDVAWDAGRRQWLYWTVQGVTSVAIGLYMMRKSPILAAQNPAATTESAAAAGAATATSVTRGLELLANPSTMRRTAIWWDMAVDTVNSRAIGTITYWGGVIAMGSAAWAYVDNRFEKVRAWMEVQHQIRDEEFKDLFLFLHHAHEDVHAGKIDYNQFAAKVKEWNERLGATRIHLLDAPPPK